MTDTATMSERQRKLAAARFDSPDRIPVGMNLTMLWSRYGVDAVWELVESHPLLFPGATKPEPAWRPTPPPWRQAGRVHRDSWGCAWETVEDHMTGAVTDCPLADWGAFGDFKPPDPEHELGWCPVDWNRLRRHITAARNEGRLAQGRLRHGFGFLTLSYLRGYDNLLFDMADEEERLPQLCAMVEGFALGHVERYLEAGVEWLVYPEDLGMQRGPMLSPEHFRRYIVPMYRRLMRPALDAGVVVYMHSDGDLRTLTEDILACGVQVLNCQDQVNGIEWLRDNVKGRCAIELDLDRQHLPLKGSPQQIDEHVHRCVDELNAPEGGLMLMFGGDDITLSNAWAMADALERYSGPR